MNIVSTAHNVIQPTQTRVWQSVASVPTLFFSTLFEPLNPLTSTNRTLLANTVKKIKQDGILGIMRRIGRAIQDHPADAFFTAGSLALGYTGIEKLSEWIPVAFATVGAVRNGQTLIQLGKSINAQTALERAIKGVFYAVVIAGVCSVPAAQAIGIKYSSVVEAKNKYGGGRCSGPIDELIRPSASCLQTGNEFEQCRSLVPKNVDSDLYVFTRHPSSNGADPVSIVSYGDGVCFLSALSATENATRICFPNLNDLTNRTVDVLNITLAQAHKGLDVGYSSRHIAIRSDGIGCGNFHDAVAKTPSGDKTVCALSSLKPDETSQLCFDRNNPTAVTLAKVMGIDLGVREGGKPVTIIIEDPKSIGLNVSPVPQTHSQRDGEQPICTLTAFKAGGAVSMACYDPNNPSEIVSTRLNGVHLEFPEDGKPVSIQLNPRQLGLDLTHTTNPQRASRCDCSEDDDGELW